MNLLPATARTPPVEEYLVQFVPVGHIFPTVRGDEFATEVAGLVTQGWDQWAASYFVHTGEVRPPTPPAWDADPVAWSTWVRDHVKAAFTPLARKVGLR